MEKIKYSIICFSFCLLSQFSFAQQQYDINDPRNPDCPCHKYQQQAENEYARQNKNAKVNFIANEDGDVSRGIKGHQPEQAPGVRGKPEKVNSVISYAKSKRKHRSVCINKMKFRLYNSKKGLKRVRTDLAACSKW